MKISFYLTRPKSKSPTSIFARISYSGYKLKYYTPESIKPIYWNKEAKLAKQSEKFKEYPEFNQRLRDWKTDVANIFRKWVNDHQGAIPSANTLKEMLDKEIRKIESKHDKLTTFFGFFNDLIIQTENRIRLQPSTGKPYTKATIQVYKNTLKRLKVYEEFTKRKIDFNSITVEFYTEFTGYLSNNLNLASNTIGKDIKTIKSILNEATERGINNNTQYKSRKFSVTREDTDAIYLTAEELESLEKLDLSKNSRLENVRDLFLIGCYTGLRFSDWSTLQPEQIKDGYIEVTQAKTGASIVIPVHETVKRILDKYHGKLPNSISNQKTNEYLKEIGQIKPEGQNSSTVDGNIFKSITKGGIKVVSSHKKWELLCTHTARRSFATNEYLAGTPTLTIMAITGHKTEKAFLRYIKLTSSEHAKLLKLHWESRNNLKAV
jgi:hypothetical protein